MHNNDVVYSVLIVDMPTIISNVYSYVGFAHASMPDIHINTCAAIYSKQPYGPYHGINACDLIKTRCASNQCLCPYA